MLRFELDLEGANEVERLLSDLEERFGNLQPVFGSIIHDFWQVEAEQFESEGGLSGGWVELSPAYAKWKAQHAPDAPILVLSGRLRESLTGETDDTVLNVEDDTLEIGSRAPTAVLHQTGTSKMPARPPLVITDAVKDRWVKYVENYLMTGEIS